MYKRQEYQVSTYDLGYRRGNVIQFQLALGHNYSITSKALAFLQFKK